MCKKQGIKVGPEETWGQWRCSCMLMVVVPCVYITLSKLTVHFKQVKFIVCKLYLNKVKNRKVSILFQVSFFALPEQLYSSYLLYILMTLKSTQFFWKQIHINYCQPAGHVISHKLLKITSPGLN